MAVNLNSAIRFRRSSSLLPESLHFRRQEKTRATKIRRKYKIRLRHIILSALLLTGIFLLIQQTYLFLLSWEQMNVKEIELISKNKDLREAYIRAFSRVELGNIILLDIQKIQNMMEANAGVKEIRIRKAFPSSIKIYVQERIPAALIDKGGLFLIDRDNTILKGPMPQEAMSLPLITDGKQFQKEYLRKMESVWTFWDSLSPHEKNLIRVIDVKNPDCISVLLKEDSLRIILGKTDFSGKLNLFLQNKEKFYKYGRLEYVDLRFQDRIYIKPSNRSVYSTAARR